MGAVKQKQQLQVLSQLGSWTVSSEELKGQFAGFHRGRTAFRVTRRRATSDDGETRVIYRVEARIDGLTLKTPGSREEKKAAPGDYWDLDDSALADSSIRLGKLIWSFKWVQVPFHMVLAAQNPESWLRTDPESEKFRRLAFSVLASLLLLLSLLQFLPEIEVEPKVLYSETVTLAIPKASNLGGVDTRLIQRPVSQSAAMAEEAVAKPKPEPIPAIVEPKPEERVDRTPPKGRPAAAKVSKATTGPSAKPAVGAGESVKAKALKNELTAALSTMARSSAPSKKAGSGGEAIGRGESILNSIRGASGGGAAGLRLSGVPGGTKDPRQVALGGQGSGVGYGKGVHAKVTGQGGGMVPMDLGGLKVNQGLTRDEVGRVIQKHMDEIRYCYEHAKVHAAYVDGKLQTFFTITGGGAVSVAKVMSSTVSSPVLEDCVLRKLRTWQFPKPRGGVQVDVSYPFVFRTLGAVGYE